MKPYSFLVTEGRLKRKHGTLDENPKLPVRNGNVQKRKRGDKDEDSEAGGASDVQETYLTTKRARKTAAGKPVPTRPKDVSPAPPRDSQVLKKSYPTAKKNANYGKRAKAVRTAPAACDSAALLGDDDTLVLKTSPVEPRVESPLVNDGDDGDYVLSPPAPEPQTKSKAAQKPKSRPAKKLDPPKNPKANAVKAKAKTQTGTRTRVNVTRAKGADAEKIVQADPPRKTRANANSKRKPEVVPIDGGEGKEEEGGAEKVELIKDSPVFIEIFPDTPEPPKPNHKPVSQVILQEVLFNSSHSIHAFQIVTLIRFIPGTCGARTRNRQSDDNPSRTEEGYFAPG